MNLPEHLFDLLIPIVLVSVALGLVHYLTKGGRNFRSSRNRKARKQF